MAREVKTAILTKVIDESPTTKRFFFEVPGVKTLEYKAGQFFTLDLPIESKVTLRSYSIASTPDGSNTFELCIVLKEGGLGTTYLFGIPIGTEVKFIGPFGKFVLPEKIETDICFIGTGTGIAPLRSMIYDIYNKNIPHKNIYLIFGNRFPVDILYGKEFEELEAKHPEFKFIGCLSRVKPPEWNGPTGYVHKYYPEFFADGRPAEFYICGWTNMVQEARDTLTNLGYDKKNIHFEKFD